MAEQATETYLGFKTLRTHTDYFLCDFYKIVIAGTGLMVKVLINQTKHQDKIYFQLSGDGRWSCDDLRLSEALKERIAEQIKQYI
jgi:hypothetical protein